MNLYTSDFKFLKGLALAVGIVLFISMFSSMVLIHTTEAGLFAPQGYQRDQLKKAGKVDVVFIGDSSLGNAVHDDYFTEISGLKTVNMATTGFYGFEGSYMMLKDVHKSNPELKLAVISQTFDMMQRPVSYEGYMRVMFFNKSWSPLEVWNDFKSNPKLLLGMGGQILRTFFDTRNVFRAIRELHYTHIGLREKRMALNIHDFFGKKDRLENPDDYLEKLTINEDKIYFLKKIADYCHETKLTCVYMTAPYYDKGIKDNKEYADRSDELFRETTKDKMIYVTPFWSIPKSKVGNSLDHLYYVNKKDYTKQALQRLKKAGAL